MPRYFTYGVETEQSVHAAVCDYLRLRYPHVLFRSDYAAGLKLTIGQATRHKRLQSSRAWPDLFIARSSLYYSDDGSVEEYHGLFLELKRADVTIYKKDGTLVANPHVREQAAMLERLRALGYSAHFARGFDEARRLIDEYLEDQTAALLTDL